MRLIKAAGGPQEQKVRQKCSKEPRGEAKGREECRQGDETRRVLEGSEARGNVVKG